MYPSWDKPMIGIDFDGILIVSCIRTNGEHGANQAHSDNHELPEALASYLMPNTCSVTQNQNLIPLKPDEKQQKRFQIKQMLI